MPEYDSSFDPPAPVVWVEVQNRATGTSVRLRAQIDTGSSISVLPLSAVSELRLTPGSDVIAASFDGTPYRLSTYVVAMLLEGFVVLDAEIAAGTRDDLLLGRDVLQHFILTLNGKKSKFDLVDP